MATYLIGLPVVVTIGDDGTVTLAVCPEDLSVALADEDAPDADVAAADKALDNRALLRAALA